MFTSKAFLLLLLSVSANAQTAVELGTAGTYAILAKTGITTTLGSSIVGNMGVSPIAAASMTGFTLIMDSSNEFSTSMLVTGKVYAADYTEPTPTALTTAVLDMQAAYTDAAGRPNSDGAKVNLGAGILGVFGSLSDPVTAGV